MRVELLRVERQPYPAQLARDGQPQRSQVALDPGPQDGELPPPEPAATGDPQRDRLLVDHGRVDHGRVDRLDRGGQPLVRYLADEGERDVPQVPRGDPGTGPHHGEPGGEPGEVVKNVGRWVHRHEQPHAVP
ncbi:MAG: hypothetical protein AUG44_15880 [Actinobacteria bacterium 13_1_20CM_3_71_11]|nr:MAG: hypothetical protein AUG44_15880 [Actinobacteria bacterium 13_1_20CM_3_71_11]